MNIIMLGAPGSGKGTHAAKLSSKYNLPHISTGDIFRQNIRDLTHIGRVAKEYIDKGQLVPDEVTIEIVKQRLSEDDCKNGYFLDGFPRTAAQAEALGKFAEITAVVNLDVDPNQLLGRISGRRVCAGCGNASHTDDLKDGEVCAKCGGEYIQREDDAPKTVAGRLMVYGEQTKPLIDYYTKQGLLINISGHGSIENTQSLVRAALDKL